MAKANIVGGQIRSKLDVRSFDDGSCEMHLVKATRLLHSALGSGEGCGGAPVSWKVLT